MLRSWYPTDCGASPETEAEKDGNKFTLFFEFPVDHNTTCLHPGKMHIQYVGVVTFDIVSHWLDVTGYICCNADYHK